MNDGIIHIARDEKFINAAYWQFEKAHPGKNTFFILVADTDDNLRHVVPSDGIVKVREDDMETVTDAIGADSFVVFHSLSPGFFPIVERLPQTAKCLWLCFGYEVYNDANFYPVDVLFDKETAALVNVRRETAAERLKRKLRPWLRRFMPNLPVIEWETKKKVLSRIDYLGCPFREEFDSVQQMMGKQVKPFPFCYYPLEKIADINQPAALPGRNIIVGNSGSETINHLDVFYRLKDLDLKGRKVIVPLSYGHKPYIEAIRAKGHEILPESFRPLTDFMTITEYNEILQSCGVAIFNNRRQQAVGNTIGLLWFGSKVFLSERNPAFHYFRRIGVKVFSYENEFSHAAIDTLLTIEEIRHNRDILWSILNTGYVEAQLRENIAEIFGQ